MFEVTVEHTFSAAHALRNYHGKCERLHGHNWRVQVTMEGSELDESGMLVDFTELKRVLRKVSERVDHYNLNEVPPFDAWNPSAENIARFFAEEIARGIPVPNARVAAVRVWETDTSVATYRP
jgi:6-pyruvoyltetrahydropterin/6-carboxytetrahydropterin synthase